MQRYELEKVIGEGSFGTVYLARDIHLGRRVAVKRIQYSEDAILEAKILERSNCDGVPKIYDLIVNEDTVDIIMEYAEGISLREYIDKNKPLSEDVAVAMILKIAHIIKELHDLKPAVIYRDLKPENIIVKSDGSVMLIDFGAAFRRDYSGDDGIEGFGTRGYSAPELWRGIKATKESDIYSLGVIFLELLTGVSPYEDTLINRPLNEYDAGLSPGLSKIYLTCVNEDLALRYTRVDDLIKALNNYHKDERSEIMKITVKKIIVVAVYMTGIALALRVMYENTNKSITPKTAVSLSLCALIPMLIHYIILYKSMKNNDVIVCKEIFLSSKKGYGLFTGIMFLGGIIVGALMYEGIDNKVYANDNAKSMWVDLKDDNERKILVREEGVLTVNDKVRLEIPAENMPEDESTLKVIVTGDDGTSYVSRSFKIKTLK